MPITDKQSKEWGKLGGKQKGINNETKRKKLLAIIEKEVDVMMYNIIRSRIQKNDELERIIKAWKK